MLVLLMVEAQTKLLAEFKFPDAGSHSKEYTNTYLWDTFYSKNERYDANNDLFQDNYYKTEKTYSDYPLYQAATPYLIGFPGSTYYEFDLSGVFGNNHEALNTKDDTQIDAPNMQSIIFVSAKNALIAVSDDELSAAIAEKDNYQYRSAYASKPLAAGSFMLNTDGSKYLQQGETTTIPFRPYFVPKSSGTRSVEKPTNTILIGDAPTKLKGTTTAIQNLYEGDDLLVKGGKKKIMVESQLHYTTDVRIVTPAGITLTTFSIQPSEYVETRVETAGVYIVYADNGKYVKKVIVR